MIERKEKVVRHRAEGKVLLLTCAYRGRFRKTGTETSFPFELAGFLPASASFWGLARRQRGPCERNCVPDCWKCVPDSRQRDPFWQRHGRWPTFFQSLCRVGVRAERDRCAVPAGREWKRRRVLRRGLCGRRDGGSFLRRREDHR